MRLLRFNNLNVEIDENTSIGIDFQAYDIKQPGSRKVKITNNFSIPRTTDNLKILGNPDNIHSTSQIIYNTVLCDYWVDNEHLIKSAKVRIESLHDRIECFVYQKLDFWDNIKNFKYSDFVNEYFNWLVSNDYIYHSTNKFSGTLQSFVNLSTTPIAGHSVLCYWAGNLASQLDKHRYYAAFSDYSGTVSGTTKLTLNNHSVKTGDVIKIWNSDDYLTLYDCVYIDQNSFYITANYQPITIYTFFVFESKYVENENQIYLNYNDPLNDIYGKGGHFAFFVKSIFQFLEYKYSISFLTNTSLSGNIWDDAYISNLFTPIRDINLFCDYTEIYQNDVVSGNYAFVAPNDTYITDILLFNTQQSRVRGSFYNFNNDDVFDTVYNAGSHVISINRYISRGSALYLTFDNLTSDPVSYDITWYYYDIANPLNSFYLANTASNNTKFAPYTDVSDKGDKTVYDLVNAFFQHCNIIIDEYPDDTYFLSRFDDISTKASFVDWSGKLQGKNKFKPLLEGYAQTNLIKFKEVYPGGDKLLNSKTITCLNKNIDAKTDLFEIDAYIPAVFDTKQLNYFGLDLSTKESFKTFSFFTANTQDNQITYNIFYSEFADYKIIATNTVYWIPGIYALTNEYNTLNNMLQYPVVYEIKKWLTLSDIRNLKFFRKYFFKELGGSFFLNKISGFNPQKSNNPTDLEIVLIDRTAPLICKFENYWVDGNTAIFTDGQGNSFIW